MEENLTFAILYQSSESRTEKIELLEYDTVENLKIIIHNLFDVPPHKQIIDGWKNVPEDDSTILQFCSNVNRINYLTVRHLDLHVVKEHIDIDEDDTSSLEIQAAQSCFKQTYASMPPRFFNIVSLTEAIEQALKVSAPKRKALLLYMHNPNAPFSGQFLKLLGDESILEILRQSFFFVGWDVEKKKYHNALCKVLKEADLEHLCNFVETKMCSAVIVQNIHGQLKVQVVFYEATSPDDLLKHLSNSRDYLLADSLQAADEESDRQAEEDSPTAKDEIDSRAFQKLMADRLGDRDYDCYEHDQQEHLKNNIGYALFGPPTKEDGYVEKELKKIEDIYKAVTKNSEKIAEYKGQVQLSSIFNCTEPLPSEKQSRKKKNANYNPNTDILPVPVFVLRKCRESDKPCRIFIDDLGRKYESWTEYINRNKLDKCIMVLPKDGRYKVEGEEVILETYESPSCHILKKVLQVGDIASTVGSLGSGGVMLAAGATSITTIAFAPAALITAGVVGAGAGAYALGRSIGHLVDRVKHEECLSLANSEARGIYFNLLAGSLGFVGAGASMAVSQLATNGVNIGKGVSTAVNTIGVANIGVSGASIVNSGYDVFDQWYNQNQKPSLLTIVQLSSSILFFGSAVYNFKTCQTIVEESQAKVLQDYSDSLRSNRHRKTFNKMMKETIRQNDGNQAQGHAEVIRTIRNIANKDEVFAVLTRTNKVMNKNGVKFFASDGEITLNGQTINMNEFIVMNKQEASAFLSNLPLKTDISSTDTASLINRFSLKNWSLPNVQQFAEYALRLIGEFGSNIQGILLQIVHDLIPIVTRLCKEILDKIFPDNSMEIKLLCMVMEFFGGKASEFLKNYQRWRDTGSYNFYDQSMSNVPANKEKRYIWIFTKLVLSFFGSGKPREHVLKEILKFAEEYIVHEIYEYQRRQDAKDSREQHSPERPQRVPCKICSGYFFKWN